MTEGPIEASGRLEPGALPPSPSSPARARRRRALRLAAAALVLAFCLGAIEVSLRLSFLTRAVRADPDTWHEFDEVLGWRARRSWTGTGSLPPVVVGPGEPPPPPVEFPVRTNALGLRHDHEVSPAPAPGTARIAFVGDSFVFGFGVAVEDGVVARLESALRSRLVGGRSSVDPDVEVLNLGTCAYGVDQMRLVVERQALDLAPGFVLVGVIDHDFRRTLRSVSLTGHRKPRFVLAEGPDGARVRLVGTPLARPPVLGGLMLSDAPPEGGSFLLWRLGDLFDRVRVVAASGAEGARLRWRLGAALLRDAARLCRARGVPFGVVLFPIRKNLEEGEPLRALIAGLEPDVAVFDVYPAFESASDRASLFLYDGHLSARGHAVAADAIARWLAERVRVVPRSPGTSVRVGAYSLDPREHTEASGTRVGEQCGNGASR